MRFNYLRNAPPDAIDRLRSFRIAKPLQWPLAVIGTIAVTYLGAYVIFGVAIGAAHTLEAEAVMRLDASKAALAERQLERVRVDDLLAFDRRLRAIRTSGSRVSLRLADIANRVPEHAWLTTLSRTSSGIAIAGKSTGFPVVGTTMEGLMKSATLSAPTLIRANEEDHRHIVVFEVHADERTR